MIRTYVSNEWTVLKFGDKIVELFREIEVDTNTMSVAFSYPPEIKIDSKRSSGFVVSSHTGTSGFRASEISIGTRDCWVRVYYDGQSFKAHAYLHIFGILI